MCSFKPLRIFDAHSQNPMEASKWLKVQVLAEVSEIAALFQACGAFEIYPTGVLLQPGEGLLSKEKFLEVYGYYVGSLKKGEIPEDPLYRPYFNSVFTVESDFLYAMQTPDGRQLIRTSRPVVQLQTHSLDYSTHDQKFHPMVFGKESILWGIQFSYPQIFLNPETQQVEQVVDNPQFPNTRLFKVLQRWIRETTIPTPMHIGQQKVNIPIRIGKGCLDWINHHPQLAKKGLSVGQST
jgi:hypothetical protein